MKKLSKQAFEEMRLWVYRNARQIELALWQYEFENGSTEAVLSALSHYQNDDGGFGNALEADCWNPSSSPYTTLSAIGKLSAVGFTDASHPIARGILRYLGSGAHCVESGWLFSIPSNNGYPHAPWWNYDTSAAEVGHTGVTAGLVCFVLRFAEKGSALYAKALALAENLLAKFKEPDNKDDMGLDGYCKLLETVNQLGLTDRLDVTYLAANIKKHVDGAIVRDVVQWSDYSVRPSGFIKSPDSPFYKGNEDIVETELDYLIDTRQEKGVWGITWQWWDNYEKYPKAFAIAENWWKSDLDMGAIGKLKFLRAFSRLE